MAVKSHEFIDPFSVHDDAPRATVEVGPATNTLKVAVTWQLDVYGYIDRNKRNRMLVLIIALCRQ